MLERIKEFFRNKIEEVAESIYWKKYKRDTIERYRARFSISIEPAEEAQQVLDYIIRWAGKKDPIERFSNAVREIGFEYAVSIRKLSIRENNSIGFRVVVSIFRGPDIFLELNENESIMEIQHNHCFERKIAYNTYCWGLHSYEYETSRGTHIKRGNYELKINGVLNKTENYEFTVQVAGTNLFAKGKYLYLQIKEMAETIESALGQEILACHIQNLKVYPIYKIIEDSISSAYSVNGCNISISALGVSAMLSGGELVRYEQKDGRVNIVPYKSYTYKEFYTEDGAKVTFENKQYKIDNVRLEKANKILQQAKNTFDKIESLDF